MVDEYTVSEPVALRLIDREFLIACAPEERDGLLEAAGFLDRKMRELRANAKAPEFRTTGRADRHQRHPRIPALRKQHDGQEQRLSDGLPRCAASWMPRSMRSAEALNTAGAPRKLEEPRQSMASGTFGASA
jgi:cell division protein ZapA